MLEKKSHLGDIVVGQFALGAMPAGVLYPSEGTPMSNR